MNNAPMKLFASSIKKANISCEPIYSANVIDPTVQAIHRMEFTPHITIEQWRTLLAVVDAGGYAQAAERLHKSQSSITYAIKKLESVLNVTVFEVQGRKAVLTPTGALLYRRARALLEEASSLEGAARKLSAGWEAELAIAVDHLFPDALLFKSLALFGKESPQTRIEVIGTVLDGSGEALLERKADLAISWYLPPGFLGDLLMPVRMIAVASPEHPLHALKRELTQRDLRAHRQLVVRDSSTARSGNAVTIDAKQRWTVSHLSMSIDAACRGLGFAWFPEEKIREQLASGRLVPLPLREGSVRSGALYLIFAERDTAGPGVVRLAELIRMVVKEECDVQPDAGRLSDVNRRSAVAQS